MKKRTPSFRQTAVFHALLGCWAFLIVQPWSGPLHPAPRDGKADIARMESGVVRIRAGIDEGEETLAWQTGTGFVIRGESNRHYLLTVTHVVKGADKIEIEYRHRPHLYIPAKVVRMQGRDPNGIALLLVEGRPPPGTRTLYVERRAALNTPVIAMGFPRKGEPWHTTRGSIRGLSGPKITFSARVDSGNSGGPLFNAAGRVIGIVTSTAGAEGFAARSSAFGEILAGWGLELPNAPTATGKGIKFPVEWSAFFDGVLVERLFATKDGYLLFGNRMGRGKGPFGPLSKAVIFRLDRGWKPVEEKILEGRPFMRPGGQRSAKFLGAVRRQAGDFFFLVQETGPRGMVSRLIHCDERGRPSGRVVGSPKTNPPLSNSVKFLAKAGSDLLASPGNGRVLRFAPFSGKVFWDTGYRIVKQIFQLEPTAGEGAYLAGLDTITHVVAGKASGKRKITGNINKLVASRSGGVLIAQGRKGLNDIPGMPGTKAFEARLWKLNAYFNSVWDKNLSLAGSRIAHASNVWELRDGHIVAVSHDNSVSGTGAQFVSIVFLNAKGEELWRKQIIKDKGVSGDAVKFRSLLERPDGSFILGGARKPSAERTEGFIFALNRKGEFIAPLQAK